MTNFTVVSAIYNVSEYLQDFIKSLESQDYPKEKIEIVLVNDGSLDNSLEILEVWRQQSDLNIDILDQPNQGQAAARNAGLKKAHGDWVTFLDPDDCIKENYFSQVAMSIKRWKNSSLIATKRVILDESSGEIIDNYPLRNLFNMEDKEVDLTRFPNHFWHAASSAFFKLEVIRGNSLEFSIDVKPNFEDGHFLCNYIFLTQQRITFLGSAQYIYRRRSDKSSTLQTSWNMDEKYLNVPKLGYLNLLSRSTQIYGYTPEWLQNLIIYELSWYFTEFEKQVNRPKSLHEELSVEFVQILFQIRSFLNYDVIESFRVRKLSTEVRELLLHGLVSKEWHSPHITMIKFEKNTGLLKVRYKYVGSPPKEEIFVKGEIVSPMYSKIRSIERFGNVFMYEHIFWIKITGTINIKLNNIYVDLVKGDPEHRLKYLRPKEIERIFSRGGGNGTVGVTRANALAKCRVSRFSRNIRTSLLRRKYSEAWLLIDRPGAANDNAERLFEYLRAERPEIDAYFGILKSTPDWERLKASKNRKRVVSYGSVKWFLIHSHARYLISSHLDNDYLKTNPYRVSTRSWKFIFLQHGVISNNLSKWLNKKREIDLLVTSTLPEFNSVAGDGPYLLSSKEVKLLGLSRWDRLEKLSEEEFRTDHRYIVVAPTWRHRLITEIRNLNLSNSDEKSLFKNSRYWKQWSSLVNNPDLIEAATTNSIKFVFIPHPEFEQWIDKNEFGSNVEVFKYSQGDVQQLISHATFLITDYSSLAFDFAYLSKISVYFHFDAIDFFNGHMYERGYFDYQTQGFGPVCISEDETVKTVTKLFQNYAGYCQDYQDRFKIFRPERGKICENTVKSIELL